MSPSSISPVPAAGPARVGPRAVGLIALMVIGSVSLWIGSPLFWLWFVSQLESSTQPSMGPLGLLILGLILTSVGLGKGLAALNRAYGRVTGSTATVHIILPWRRSLRGGRSQARQTDGRHPVTVLDVVMVVSVLIAALALAAFMIFVHPAPPGLGGEPAKH